MYIIARNYFSHFILTGPQILLTYYIIYKVSGYQSFIATESKETWNFKALTGILHEIIDKNSYFWLHY